MLADMHCHYPMRLVAEDPSVTLERMKRVRRRPRWIDWLRARVVRHAAKRINYDKGWRVSLEELERGDVRAVFSVLFEPFAEIDLDNPYGSRPQESYYEDLLERIDGVEADLAARDPQRRRHEIVTSAAALRRTLEEGKVAFMHCVEGGFHLGPDVTRIPERVEELKRRGVVYITVAHLFWRQVATNAPALPFLSDRLYRRIFRQPREGLSELGEAIVEAMYEQRMLIDVSHMSEQALNETFDLLERLDERSGHDPTEHPVVATHAGYRFGRQEYMLSRQTIERIARRGGVIGLIFAQHQLNEAAGVENPDDPQEAIEAICGHIEQIRRCAGSHDHVAIGSDLDGFIEPTLAGFETAGDLARLVEPLEERFGAEARKFFSGNAIRVAEGALG